MKKYFLDTEFIEHATGIELLSIGIVCEDGRTFYAENTAVDIRLADDWVKENVISKLNAFKLYNSHSESSFKNYTSTGIEIKGNYIDIKKGILEFIGIDNPIFYAYYADYDWVVFCKIFGRMIDLPSHFPMYCRDLKQTLDEKVEDLNLPNLMFLNVLPKDGWNESYEPPFDLKLKWIKENHSEYPKQTNEHNALDDAKWNFELYKFLETI